MTSKAAIYCRISDDREGESLGVTRQQQDCEKLAQSQGLSVVSVYVDNDMGASTRSRKKSRPQYDAMMKAARVGEFSTIIAYSNSRLTRRPLELEALISLHESHGIRLTTVVSGNDDLATADGRMVARIKASVDAGEVERTAERVARKHLQNAQAGVPVGGTRPFGYEKDKRAIREDEAKLIRQGVADVIAGVPMRRIARDWEQAGARSEHGNVMHHAVVRQILVSPRIAGFRVHQGKMLNDASGQPVRGQWEPIITPEDRERVLAALKRPDNRVRKPRKGARIYLLSGLLTCGVCNSQMFGNRYAEGRHYYQCSGHNSISGVGLDEAITQTMLARFASTSVETKPERFDGETRLDEVTKSISELMAAFTDGTLGASTVFPAVQRLEDERASLERAKGEFLAATNAPSASQMDADMWQSMDIDRRRAVIERTVQTVYIRRAKQRGGPGLDYGRIQIVWRQD